MSTLYMQIIVVLLLIFHKPVDCTKDLSVEYEEDDVVSIENTNRHMVDAYCGSLVANISADDTLFLDVIYPPIKLGLVFDYSSIHNSLLIETHLTRDNYSAWQLTFLGTDIMQFDDLGHALTNSNQENIERITPQEGYRCYGTDGPTVWGEQLYCNQLGSSNILRYDLRTRSLSGLIPVTDAGNFSYATLPETGPIDIAADNDGRFYAIFGSVSRSGQLTIVEFNPTSMVALNTYYTGVNKSSVGNAFMLNGVLYATISPNPMAHVSYAYNTRTNMSTIIPTGNLPLQNTGEMFSLKFNPKTNQLYSYIVQCQFFSNGIHTRRCG